MCGERKSYNVVVREILRSGGLRMFRFLRLL